MADKYVSKTGLSYFFGKLKTIFAEVGRVTTLEGKVQTLENTGGQPNVIETVKVNGTALTVTSKAVNVTVPTKTSDITNDGDGSSNFATQSWVATNGGKIDVIKVNNVAQTITSKTVNISVPTKVSQLTNDSKYQTETQVSTAITNAVPTKTSDITNDGDGTSAFITVNTANTNYGQIDSVKVNGTALTVTNKAVNVTVPTAVSDLTNDSGFQTASQVSTAISNALPTKTGDLTNNGDGSTGSLYATQAWVNTNGGKIDTIKVNNTAQTITNKTVNITVPTKTGDLTNNGDGTTGSLYATQAWVNTNGGKIDVVKVNGTALTITNKAVDVTVPTKVSQLTNDSGFQTASQVSTAISNAVSSAYKYKGSVAAVSNLPTTGNTVGDVYNVEANGANYAWDGTAWDALGQIVDLTTIWLKADLTAVTTAEIDTICAS
ncbi:MAG: hypothetical protein IJT28_08110 [Bacteroidaceae bacterium]|nr:hypothetical protein [Bacteroidaceae bacterium]